MNTALPLVALLGLAAIACGPDGQAGCRPLAQAPRALVIGTDYQTGSLSAVDTGDLAVHRDLGVLHPDAACQIDPGTGLAFIISRLGADSIAVLDPADGLCPLTEYSVGPGSNAQDLAVVAPDRAYVLRLADPDLLVIDPRDGRELDRVDLSPWADADGVPEAAWAVVHQGKVYVALQRLADFQPTDYSSVLVLDGATGAVEREIRLSAPDPFARMRYAPAIDRLVVASMGQLFELDGGLEFIDPADGSASGLLIGEAELGGDLTDAVVVNAHKGYAVVADTQPDYSQITRVVAFDPTGGTRGADLLVAAGYDHAFLALSPDGSQLWVTERSRQSPGLRIFDTASDLELTDQPLDVGLPPFMVCFLP